MLYKIVNIFMSFVILVILGLGLQKNRSLVSLYDRTGVCTIRTLIKNDENDLRTGTRAEFRPFSEALMDSQMNKMCRKLVSNFLGLWPL